jgi:hypothetical protein
VVGRSGDLKPCEVVIVDDSTLYGHGIRHMVTAVLGSGRGADDRAECISHQEAMSAPDKFWQPFSVGLVDAYDAHAGDEATPVPVGDVVRRLMALGSPSRLVVYSANFDNPYFNRFVRDATDAMAYYDASALLRPDAKAMRSALLDDQPSLQADIPTAEQVGEIGHGGDLAKAILAYQQDAQVWSWAQGLTPWRSVDAYRRQKVRSVARKILKMSPAERAAKVRDGRQLRDRSPDHDSIRRVIQTALRLPNKG